MFVETDGGIERLIRDHLDYDLTHIFDKGRSKQDTEKLIETIGLEMVRYDYDATTGPIMRAVVLETSFDCDYLILNISHLACDFASLAIVAQFVLRRYSGSQSQHEEPDRLQAVDFAVSQRQYLQAASRKELQRAHIERLCDVNHRFMPFGRTASGQPNEKNLRVEKRPLPDWFLAGGMRQIKGLAAAMIALQVVELSAHSSFSLLMPRMNRQAPFSKDIVGYIANTIMIRAPAEREQALPDFIKWIKGELHVNNDTNHIPYALLAPHLTEPPNVSFNYFPGNLQRDLIDGWCLHGPGLMASLTSAFDASFYVIEPLREVHFLYFDSFMNQEEARLSADLFVAGLEAVKERSMTIAEVVQDLRHSQIPNRLLRPSATEYRQAPSLS